MAIGTITLGHAPREDITDDMRRELPDGVGLIEAGALDHLDSAEAVEEAVGARPGEPPFVTTLRDGSSVLIDRADTATLIQERIRELEAEVELIGVLCTGAFPEFESAVPVLETGDLLRSWARSIAPGGTIGVLVPKESQVETAVAEFEGMSVVAAAASPYEDDDAVREAAEGIGSDTDLIVMKCMGYDYGMKAAVREATGTPALLPRSVLVKTMTELL